MRALARVQAIYFHNPDQIERERLERIDRATVDQRIQLIQRIADRLRSDAREGMAQPAREGEPLWEWLCMFLGTRPMIAGIEEKNSLVRVNALHAMSTLPSYRSRFLAELQRVLSEPALDRQVVEETVTTLASMPGSTQDAEILDTLAAVILSDRRSGLPLNARYRIVRTIQESPLRKQYRNVLLTLQRDEASSIQLLARETLKDISGS
jgi:hypothetical protein